MAGAIVVAVDNVGALRMIEYNPWTNASPATFADGRWTVAVMGNRDVYLATEVLRPLMMSLAKQR